MTAHDMKHAASDSARLEAVGGRLSRADGSGKISGGTPFPGEEEAGGLGHAGVGGERRRPVGGSQSSRGRGRGAAGGRAGDPGR